MEIPCIFHASRVKRGKVMEFCFGGKSVIPVGALRRVRVLGMISHWVRAFSRGLNRFETSIVSLCRNEASKVQLILIVYFARFSLQFIILVKLLF